MKYLKYFGIFTALLVCAHAVQGDWVNPWVRKNVSSQRDALYIDMPTSIHRMEPVTITVYINDPVVKSEANVMEVNPDNNNFYSIEKKIIRDSSGRLRAYIPYSGESTVAVGFKTNEFWTNEVSYSSIPEVYFSFWKVKKPSGTGYPDTSTPTSEYYGYECHSYHSPYFCGEQKECMVCVKAIAIVWHEYAVLPSRAVATPPAGYKWVDNRGTDKDLLTNPAYLSYSYIDENKPVAGQYHINGNPVTCTDSYSVSIDSRLWMDTDFSALKKDYERYNKEGIASGKTKVSETSGPGGIFNGKAVEIVTRDSGGSQWDWYSVSLEMFAATTPENSGLGHIKMSRSGCTPKGGSAAEMEKAIAGLKSFAASYSVQYEGSPKPGFVPKHYYDILRREAEDSITGRITDGRGNPMPYMTVSIEYDGRSYEGRTDESGTYSIRIPGLEYGAENPKIATLRIYLSYIRDGKNYFNVLDHIMDDRLVAVEKNFSLETEMDKTQDFDFGATSFTDTSSTSILNNLKHIGPIYYHLSEITDFALTHLKANIDYKLPVDVYFASQSGTAYSRDTSTITININDSAYGSSNRPDNREYHEFCHHILFSQWNGEGLRGPGDTNHGGYINTGTGDSYTEGFAEFCAMVCSKYRGDPKPEIYAGFGSMEQNYKAWEHRGYDEELALNGILWDLYDDKNDANDTISLPLDRMWEVMKVKRPNFYEYYKAFKQAFPDKADAIDRISIDHGFFADKHEGNKRRDPEEPYRDANGDKVYNLGEFYVDYGNVTGIAKPTMQYVEGYTIGKATNYERENRSSIVKLSDSYVKAADPSVTKYLIKVHFSDRSIGEDYEYTVDAWDGLVYVAPIPEDLNPEISIEPYSKAYSSDKPYKTTNSEFLSKYYTAKPGTGYADVHDFEIKPTGQREENLLVIERGPTGSGGSFGPIKETFSNEKEISASGGNNMALLLGGAGILLVLGGIGLLVLIIVFVLIASRKRTK